MKEEDLRACRVWIKDFLACTNEDVDCRFTQKNSWHFTWHSLYVLHTSCGK